MAGKGETASARMAGQLQETAAACGPVAASVGHGGNGPVAGPEVTQRSDTKAAGRIGVVSQVGWGFEFEVVPPLQPGSRRLQCKGQGGTGRAGVRALADASSAG